MLHTRASQPLTCVQAMELAHSKQAALRQLGDALAAQEHARTAQGQALAPADQRTQQPVCPLSAHRARVVIAPAVGSA